MKLEQHIYTSGKKGFGTIAATPGISRQEQFSLEKHSLYMVPGALLYKEDISRPIKYVFYPLGQKRLVVGRAVYAGKDSMGRSGNYFFHNFIMEKEDMLKAAPNPAELIKSIEKKKLFIDKIPDKPLEVIEISVEEIKKHEDRKPQIPDDFIVSLLRFCMDPDLSKAPILLVGTDKKCLDFLEWLYGLLPDGIIDKISFDTYSYGTGLDFRIAGVPQGAEFQPYPAYGLKIGLATEEHVSNLKAQAPSELISFVARKAAAGEISQIKAVYFMEECVRKGDYSSFKEKYKSASSQIREFTFSLHKRVILDYIADEKDMDLLDLVIKKIGEEDLSAFSSAPDIIFKSEGVWKLFLNKIRRQPQDIDFLMEEKAAKELAGCYSSQLEETLLETMLSVLPEVSEDKKLSRIFTQVIEGLPASKAKGADLLKVYIGYELTDGFALLKKMISGDMAALPEKYRELILDSVLEGIIATYDFEDMPKEFNIVFEKSADKAKCLARLLHLLEDVKMPNKTKSELKDVFLSMHAKLPQDENAKNLKEKIEELFKSKPSLLKRILLGRDSKADVDNEE